MKRASIALLMLLTGIFLSQPALASADQTCDQSTLDILGNFHPDASVIASTCKPWPNDDNIMLAAAAYLPANPELSDDPDLPVVVAMIDSAKHTVLRDFKSAVVQDATFRIQSNSDLWLDTARYNLAPGVRAFGLVFRTGSSHSCGNAFWGQYLVLFLPEDNKLEPLLAESIPLEQGRIEHTCSEKAWVSKNLRLTISVEKTRSHGFADLSVMARDRDTGKLESRTLLHYNGHLYEFPEQKDWDTYDSVFKGPLYPKPPTVASGNMHGEILYAGHIGDQSVQFVVSYGFNNIYGLFALDADDNPHPLTGKLHNKTLTLSDPNKDPTGKFVFTSFERPDAALSGEWFDASGKKPLPVTLKPTAVVQREAPLAYQVDMLQLTSTKTQYFKTTVEKLPERSGPDFYPHVVAVKVFEKGTDRLIQTLPLSEPVEYRDINGIETDDYNFDGKLDFSLFEHSYVRYNSSRIYFLQNPDSDTYFRSSFEGGDLTFDQKTKLIHEFVNETDGYRTATYKVVDNKMVQVDISYEKY